MFHCFRVSVFQCFSDDSRGLSPRRDHGSDRSRFKEQAEIKCEAPEAGRSRGAGARGKQRAGGPADSSRAATGGIPTEPDGAKARRPPVRGLSVRPGANAPKRSEGQVPKARRSRPQGPARCRPASGLSTVYVRRIPGPTAERTSRGRPSDEGFAPAARCPSAARREDEARRPSADGRTVAPKSAAPHPHGGGRGTLYATEATYEAS